MQALESINKNPKLKLISLILGITVIWMISGLLRSSKKVEPTQISKDVSPRLMTSVASVKTKYIVFTGTAFANDSVDLMTQITGHVIKKFVSDGASLKTGDKIIQIENTVLIERLSQMKDALESAKLRYESAIKLQTQNLGSKLAVEDAKTALNTAEANLIAAQTDLNHSFITAPFDGMIDTILVQEGDMLSNMPGGKYLIGKFLNMKSIAVQTHISQKERDSIKNSTEALIISDNGNSTNAKITLIATSADQQSGTFLVKAIGDNINNLVDGESVKLKVKVGDVASHNVPISTLIIDKNGDLSIKAIDDDKSIKQYKVSIIDEDEKGIWITGLPQKCNVMLAGQSYIN